MVKMRKGKGKLNVQMEDEGGIRDFSIFAATVV